MNILDKIAYYQGTEEPTPGKKQYKSDKAVIVKPRFKDPFYRNYDYVETNIEGGPGTGAYSGKYKSIEEFRKSKKQLKDKYKADDSYDKIKIRAKVLNIIIKTAIDFPIDDQITPILTEDLGYQDVGSYSASVPIGGQTDQYTQPTDFDNKTTDQLNYGVDHIDDKTERETYKKEDKKPNMEELLNRYLNPREPAIFGLPDGIETPEDLDPVATIAPNQNQYGITDSGNTLYNNFPITP